MSVLSSIRKRGVLIASIIGIALMIFVLESLFESGSKFFWSKSNNVGEIAGHGVDIQEFQQRVKEEEMKQMQASQQSSLGEEEMENIINMVWSQYLNEYIMKTEYRKLGLAVSNEELVDLMYGKEPSQTMIQYFTDRQTNRIYPQFANPQTGQLDPGQVKKYFDKIPDEQKDVLVRIEDAVRESQVQEKYLTLVKMGLNATTFDAKQESGRMRRKVNFRYVVKKFSDIQDSTVKVTDAEIKKYYNEHLNNYKQEAARKLEYVIFDVNPSADDRKDAEDQMKKIGDELKQSKDAKSDSALVARESEMTRGIEKTFFKKGQLMPQLPEMDSTIFNSDSGAVTGPYQDKSYSEKIVLKVTKVNQVKYEPDSVNVRHILVRIMNNDTLKAKNRADSIKKAVLANKSVFPKLVKKFSADSGTAKKEGNYGWFQHGATVEQFDKASFEGKKGDVVIAKTVYGFHIIEILDKSKETRRVQVVTIDKTTEPGNKTRQEAYLKASDFAGKYNTSDLFTKGCEKEGLNKRVVESLKSTDKTIAGIENPKEIIRWCYSDETKQGMVRSEPFQVGNKYVVASLVLVKEKGNTPLEQIRDEVEVATKQWKKGDMLKDQLTKTASGISNIEALGQKLNQKVERAENASFSQFNITGLGHEPKVLGVLFAMKEGQMSKPIAGEQGAYIVMVEKFSEEENKDKNFSDNRKNLSMQMGYRADAEVYKALNDNANVVDNRVKFY